MVLENKLGIINAAELARVEEKISKKKPLEMFKMDPKEWTLKKSPL